MHLTGLLLIVIGGVMEGLFALPTKFMPNWSWENIWAAGSLGALILVPWPLAILTISHLGNVYSSAPLPAIVLALVFGAGWGFGGVFFGLGVSSLGLSLGTSLIMGLIAIGGSVVPMLLQHSDQLSGKGGAELLIGIATMVIGLIICARAGDLRTGEFRVRKETRTGSFGTGLFYCVAAGLLSALVNFALIFGAPIADRAMTQGLSFATANNAVWALVFTASYSVNVGYSIFKSARARTLGKFSADSCTRYWGLAGIMGALWAGGIVVYGRGASLGGPFGPVFGFPIMLIVSILTGNTAGAVCGEWRGQPAAAKATMAYGVGAMVLAISTLGYANFEVH